MSDTIRITGPRPITHVAASGVEVTFDCTVRGAPDDATLQWRIGRPNAGLESFTDLDAAAGASLTVAAKEEHDFVLEVRPEEGEVATSARAQLRLAKEPVAAPPWEYDEDFTQRTFWRLALVWLAPIGALLAAMDIARGALAEEAVAVLVVLQLLAVATALSMAAAYVALMEVRGMSRAAPKKAPEDVQQASKGGDELAAAAGGIVGKVVEGAPRIIETFGKLRVSAALMLLTAVTILAAAALGWRALGDANASPTPPPGATSAASAPEPSTQEAPRDDHATPPAENAGTTADATLDSDSSSDGEGADAGVAEGTPPRGASTTADLDEGAGPAPTGDAP